MDKTSRKKSWLINGGCTLLILWMQTVQLTYSNAVPIKKVLLMGIQWQALNVLIVSAVFFLLLLMTGRLTASLAVSSVLFTLLSVANHYVILFHGRAFFASDVFSIKTAAAVLPEYRLVFDFLVFRLLCIAAAEGVLLLVLWSYRKRAGTASPRSRKRGAAGAAFVASAAVLWGVFFSPWTVFPGNLVRCYWYPPIQVYGYGVTFVNSVYSLIDRFVEPAGYSPEKLEELVRAYRDENVSGEEIAGDTACPDVILILNETFFDLEHCAGIPEGREVLESVHSIPGIISGYAVVSLAGGGTNNSEYELLFSNSMAELQFFAPFTILNLNGANSVASYMKNAGYTTAAFHCAAGPNYNRTTAYKAMGFDQIYLGTTKFTDNTFFTYGRYGRRAWRDIDNYRDMIGVYETMPEDPRFMYFLTYQNHGGFEQNEPVFDTVHVAGDYGEYTDDVDEYLTSLKTSAEAFRELTEYYAEADRPVVILMVGDHAPNFIGELPVTRAYPYTSVNRRAVPYYAWANFDLNEACFMENASITDLVPMLLKSCGMPMTTYYDVICDLSRSLPVRTADELALDREGKAVALFDSRLDCADLVKLYYYLEYNNIRQADDYIDEYFTIR